MEERDRRSNSKLLKATRSGEMLMRFKIEGLPVVLKKA